MKDNAGNTLLLTCSIVILPRLPHPFPERSSKVSWNFKVIKGKLRKRFMHWTAETNIYWTSMKNIQHLLNRNLLVRLSFSIALNLKVVSIDRARHINLVGHLFSDHTLLNLKHEQQENFVSSVVTTQICSGLKCLTIKGLQVKIKIELQAGCAILEFSCRFVIESQCCNCFQEHNCNQNMFKLNSCKHSSIHCIKEDEIVFF